MLNNEFISLNSLRTRNPCLANSEDTDEAVFHQGMDCFLRQKRSSVNENTIVLENITFDPSIYKMALPDYYQTPLYAAASEPRPRENLSLRFAAET